MKSLPILDLPHYEITLLSTGQVLTIRPFTVKEEKILLMALENKIDVEIVTAIKQVIQNCIQKPEDFDVENMASFDLDWLFLNVRAHSIGEVVNQSYICKNVVNDKECGGTIAIEFNIVDPDVIVRNPEHSKTILLGDGVGVVMKYPTLALMDKMIDSADMAWDLLIDCIDYIFDADNVYPSSESTKEDLEKFIEGLSAVNYEKLDTFFQTMPKIEKTVTKACPKCGFEHKIVMDDLLSFFA